MYAWELIAARLLKEADGGMGSFFMIQKFHVKILGICADIFRFCLHYRVYQFRRGCIMAPRTPGDGKMHRLPVPAPEC